MENEERTGSGEPLNLYAGEAWPYPRRVYLLRALWGLAWATVWQVAWVRVPILRTTILRLFGSKVGGLVWMPGSVRIHLPSALVIGNGCAFGARTHLYNLGGLEVGDQVTVSQDVYVCGGTHDYTQPTNPLVRKKVVIRSYAWVAAGAFIGPGVTIGEGAVVGARAVVMKDVEPWTVVGGNPARFIKKREMKGKEGAAVEAVGVREAKA
jgi:putative colanic acid biosynthesis acetyltransferase WcaF